MTEDGATVPSRAVTWAAAAALAAATFMLYAPVLRFDFIRYDDPHYLFLNPHIVHGLSWDNVRWAATAFEVGNWHPLTLISHMTDVTLFGMRPGWHHGVNALLHAVNAALLLVLLTGATGRRAPSFVAAVLFAVHPLNVESVAWVSQRKSVLCLCFLLLALQAYVVWVRKGGAARYAAALALAAAAMATKPIAVVLPALLLSLDVWPLGRVPAEGAGRLRTSMRLLVEKAPFAVLALAASIATMAAQKAGGALESMGDPASGGRLARTTFAYAWYLVRMAWPGDLSLFYPTALGAGAALKVASAAILLVVVTAVVLALFRAKPYLAFGWAWFAASLVPVAGFVTFGTQIVADRYAYLALIGPFAALAFLGADALRGRSQGVRRTAVFGTAALILALAFGTGFALAPWRDSLAVLEHGYRRAPDNVHVLSNLGLELVKRKRYDEGIGLLRRAAEARPLYSTVHAYLGYALARTGRPAEARAEYEIAVRQQPDDPQLATELGQVLVDLALPVEAEARFLQAVRVDPDYGEAWLSLGALLTGEACFDEAEPYLERAAALMPANAGALTAWGVNLSALGRREEAKAALRKAVSVDPGFGPARRELIKLEGEGSP